nr:MAG TPA: anticodon binding domain protein [Caudoviricetes sp.]
MCAEKLCFLCCFLHVFYADFGSIRQNKIGFSSGILRIFSHKLTFVGIPPV